jgi:hypothetical protein
LGHCLRRVECSRRLSRTDCGAWQLTSKARVDYPVQFRLLGSAVVTSRKNLGDRLSLGLHTWRCCSQQPQSPTNHTCTHLFTDCQLSRTKSFKKELASTSVVAVILRLFLSVIEKYFEPLSPWSRMSQATDWGIGSWHDPIIMLNETLKLRFS